MCTLPIPRTWISSSKIPKSLFSTTVLLCSGLFAATLRAVFTVPTCVHPELPACVQLCSLYDFLPKRPAALETAAALLAGAHVPGVARERSARLPQRAVYVGRAAVPQARPCWAGHCTNEKACKTMHSGKPVCED